MHIEEPQQQPLGETFTGLAQRPDSRAPIFWGIADSHLGHDKTKETCQRPEGFEQILLENCRRMTRPNDVVIHFGDVSFYDDEKWHRLLMEACAGCNMWLTPGNHDKKTITWYLQHGWSFVAQEIRIKMFGKMLALSHRPITTSDDFDLNIHGHLHRDGHRPEIAGSTKHRLIYVEHDYKPIPLRSIVEGTAKYGVRMHRQK